MTLHDVIQRRRQRRRKRVIATIAFVVGAVVLAVAMIAAVARGAEDRDVPSAARREIAMRGNMVEWVDGQVVSEPAADLIGQAAETPPNDSNKWHLTVLVTGNNQACERLKSDLRSEALRDWVNPDDHQASHMHLHELRYDGAIGRDWGRKLEKFLGRRLDEFPTIIVQPPIDGSYGKHTEVVYMQSGYDGDAEKLTAAMARGIGKYLEKLRDHRMIARTGGHGAPPPFLLAPSSPPATPGLTVPQTIIPPRLAATVEQIKAACQGCDAEFLLSQIAKQATIEEALAAWGTEQARKQVEELKQQIDALQKAKADATKPATLPPAQPAAPSGFSLTTLIASVLTALVGGGGIYGLIALGLSMFRKFRQATGKPLFLTQEQYDGIQDFLKQINAPKAAQ